MEKVKTVKAGRSRAKTPIYMERLFRECDPYITAALRRLELRAAMREDQKMNNKQQNKNKK